MHGEFDFGADRRRRAGRCARCWQKVEQVAPTHSTVLLRGETGTGKELVARAIHINSPREPKPFVRVNCAALAPGVLESELFGHEKGAFTGAVARRPGRFELADGGTLFLDEFGDLPLDVQVKLLRVLQEREFERVGGQDTVSVDVRVVSATHRDLEQLIADGKFREDLYYRLNVFPITLPPLRERLDDMPLLVEHFVAKFNRVTGKSVRGFDPAALAALAAVPLAGQRARAGERGRARHHLARGPDVHAPPISTSAGAGARARADGDAGGGHAAVGAAGGERGAAAAGAPARAGEERDRRRHRSQPGQHRRRRARARHQPLDALLPPAQARARAPPADQAAGRRRRMSERTEPR